MASTTFSADNAFGLDVLIAGFTHTAAVADGIRLAFWLAAGGIVVSLLAALTLACKASVTGR